MSKKKTKKLSTKQFIKAWIQSQSIKDWDDFSAAMIKKHEPHVLASELPDERAINMRCAKVNAQLGKLNPPRKLNKPERPRKPQKNIASLFADNAADWSKKIPTI